MDLTIYYDPLDTAGPTSPYTQPTSPPPAPPTPPPAPPSPPPAPPTWDDIPDPDTGKTTPTWEEIKDDEEENTMILHICDSDDHGNFLLPDLGYDGLAVGTKIYRDDIAPDVPGYFLDTLNTQKVFVQTAGIYESALYYTKDPYGFEGDSTFDPPEKPDPDCQNDPLCPDNTGTWAKEVVDSPTGPCTPKDGGTICEQLAASEAAPISSDEIKKPADGKRLTIPKPVPAKKAVNQQFAQSQKWDETYDVIVYGFDLAGAIAALTAAEEGGRVVLIEKGPATDVGGYVRDTAQELIYASDRNLFKSFIQSLKEGYDYIDEAIVEAYCEGAELLPYWMTSHGVGTLYRTSKFEYSEFPGSDGAKLFRLHETNRFDRAVWNAVLRAMKPYNKKQIFLLCEAEITDLIQDPDSGTVLGVKVHSHAKNEDYTFRAKGGVILAGGGFENNEEMVENFLQMPSVIAKYTKNSDGDNIKLAMRAGADLWHMNNVSGYELHLKNFDDQLQFRNELQGVKNYQLGGRSCFVVGPNGRRFTDEGGLVRQGHIYRTGEWRAQEIPQNAWAILDHKGLTQAALAQGYSSDNLAEVSAGKIVKADSLEALATAIGIDPDALRQQFQDYQAACSQGYDSQFGRRPQNLLALDEMGPYYAVALSPVLQTTLGGPERNAACQIIDTYGDIIPNLYGAGVLGSFFPNVFPAGADLTEAFVTGQIAGVNAFEAAKGVK